MGKCALVFEGRDSLSSATMFMGSRAAITCNCTAIMDKIAELVARDDKGADKECHT